MVRYSFPVGFFHSLFHAGCSENIYPLNGIRLGGLGCRSNFDRETKPPQASQVMMGSTFAPALFRCVFSSTKYHPLFQHAVESDQHKMCHRDNGAFLATPMTAVLRIVLDKIPATRPLADLLAGRLDAVF